MAGGGESIGMIDLDKVLAAPIKVKLEGKEWKLPGDPPTEILLSIVVLSEDMEKAVAADDSDAMLDIRRELTDAVEDLFSMLQEIPEGFGAKLVDAQISELVSKLFAHYYPGAGGDRPTPEEPAEEQPAAEAPPAEEPAASTATPRRSPRSRESSARAPRRKRASASSKSSTT